MSSAGSAAAAAGDDGTPAVSTSVISAKTVTGSHVLKVDVYSCTKGLGNGKFIKSGPFNVGGHRWSIRYYPDGDRLDAADWISIFLELEHSDDALDVKLKAQFKFSLQEIGVGHPISSVAIASSGENFYTFDGRDRKTWGYTKFIERKAFEKSSFLKDDRFSLKCDVTVIQEIRTEVATQFVTVPPSDIHRHLGHLLSSEEAADITFEVDGDTISAHRLLLAARSPVFKAELYGPMKERTMSHIRIVDVEARVFKAMLHFIYTDLLPEIDKKDTMEMAQHLLVAADRYGLERLKLVCEDMLCSYITTSTAATILVLAEQHGCNGLKQECFKFLKRSSTIFKEVRVTDGFQHLTSSCPSLIWELLDQVVT